MLIDIKNKEVVDNSPYGIITVISWDRLILALKNNGTLKDYVEVTHVLVDESGLNLTWK